MRRLAATSIQCLYCDNPQDPTTRCRGVADYILLEPPLVQQRQPTPIWLGGEARTLAKAARRPEPLYCRQHAYRLCGLEVPDVDAPF